MQSTDQPLYLHILYAVLCLVTQLCPTLCDPMIVAHQVPLSMGILQARILERVAMPSSRGSSQSRAWTHISHIADRFFTIWATREALQWNELRVKVFRIRQTEHCLYISIHSKVVWEKKKKVVWDCSEVSEHGLNACVIPRADLRPSHSENENDCFSVIGDKNLTSDGFLIVNTNSVLSL